MVHLASLQYSSVNYRCSAIEKKKNHLPLNIFKQYKLVMGRLNVLDLSNSWLSAFIEYILHDFNGRFAYGPGKLNSCPYQDY
jgi:hypothetical protein